MKFYLAGPYSARADLAAAAKTIESVSGWRCTSRWLAGQHDEASPSKAAQDDVVDVREAQALVIDTTRNSTRGGMWVEFGMAVERRMPIVVMAPLWLSLTACTRQSANLTVFAYLSHIWWVADAEAAGYELRLIEQYRLPV